MDAKSKAEFINAVASGEELVCTKCGSRNKTDSKFCISCGAELGISSKNSKEEAFSNVEDNLEKEIHETKSSNYVEPESVFAQGLPEWSIEPPQVMVRRRR